MFKKRLLSALDIISIVLWIIIAIHLLTEIVTNYSKHSAWSTLQHSNLFASFLAMFIIFISLTLIGTAISMFILKINAEAAEKFLTSFAKLNFIASIVIGLLITEDSNDFQLIVTVISFVLIFQYFFPKELKAAMIDVHRSFINKWKEVRKENKK